MTCNLAKHSEQRFCCARCSRAFSSTVAFDWHHQGLICVDPSGARSKKGEVRFQAVTIPGVEGTVAVWGLRPLDTVVSSA